MQKQIDIVEGENGDQQFDTSGDACLNLLAQGPDTLLTKGDETSRANASRYFNLVNDAWNQNPKLTRQLLRYFRDRAYGQQLKEQSMLGLAVLSEHMDSSEIMEILRVHNDENKEGAVKTSRVDLLDLVRILAWHKYFYGKNAKVSKNLLNVFSKVLNKRDYCIEQVLKYKARTIPYTDGGREPSVGLVDILGMVRHSSSYPLPHEVAAEYDGYLRPYYREGQYYATPVGTLAQQQHDYFLGNLTPGDVPRGITVEQVLAHKDDEGFANLVRENKLSPYQVKSNLHKIAQVVNEDELLEQIERTNANMFPHEIFAMAQAHKKEDFSSPCSLGLDDREYTLEDALLRRAVNAAKTKNNKRVLVMADTSRSMSVPLSKNSSVSQLQFAIVMSFFAAHASKTGVFAEWGNRATLTKIKTATPSWNEVASINLKGDCGTNIVQSIEDVADYFAKHGGPAKAPEVLCLISDMQFNQCQTYYSYGTRRGRSESIQQGIDYYQKTLGFEPEIVFWNVNANTTPAVKQNGVLLMGGYSPANVQRLFSAIEETVVEDGNHKELDPDAILNWVQTHYECKQ